MIAMNWWVGRFTPAIAKSKGIDCPTCSAKVGEMCRREEGEGNHVERGRVARWIELGILTR